MHKLEKLLLSQIAAGMKRSSVRTCSAWAERYRVMGKPFPGKWTFKYHPWLRPIHDMTDELIVVQKAAQMGFTEWALNTAFFTIDVLGESVLYVLPTDNDASDFSASRFDPALQLSPHLRNLFSDVQNVGHKRAGSANLFVRGSRSRSQLKSIPAGKLIFDELDEMYQDNIPLAMERMSGQLNQSVQMLSTPSVPKHGINGYYENSTQEHFFFPCPHCSRHIELTYPECLVITADDVSDPNLRNSYYICPACKHPLDQLAKPDYLQKGIYVPTFTDRVIRGPHINQLYSYTIKPYQIAESAIKARYNPADESELYNSKLGLCHTVEGSRIDDQVIVDCTTTNATKSRRDNQKFISMGVDIGKWLHITILEWDYDHDIKGDISTQGRPRLIKFAKVLNFEDLDAFMHTYRVGYCVVDANPERRKALEFAQRFFGIVSLCFYGNGVSGRAVVRHEEQLSVTVDRTSWLDLTLGRYHQRHMRLPVDLDLEYKLHLKSLVRIYRKDKDGNPVSTYVTANNEDHYAHSGNYAEIAMFVARSGGSYSDINTY